MIIGKSLSGRIWENGEFGVAALKSADLSCHQVERQSPIEIEDWQWAMNLVRVHGIEETLEFFTRLRQGDFSRTEPESALGSSNLFNSHKREKRGTTGITAYGRKMVRNGGYRLEVETPKNRISFLTLTIPNVTIQESRNLGANWSEIIRVFNQRLKRHLQECGLPGEILGVTEIQMKRTLRDGVFGLHYHCVFVGRKPYQHWAISCEEVRLFWMEILTPYLDKSVESYDWSGCENLEVVKKSVAGYLGKYMSKGIQAMREPFVQEFRDVFPTAWWSCSTSLRKRVHSNIHYLSEGLCERLITLCSSQFADEVFLYKKPIVLEGDSGKQHVIGWTGQLQYQSMKDLFPTGYLK